MKRYRPLVLVFFLLPALSPCKEKPDPRLNDVASVFVAGNNQAAEKARVAIRNGKSCFTLAGKAADADAVLEIKADTETQGGTFGSLGARTWIASATLTLKSGDLVWSKSERFNDAPFMSGGKTTGDLLVHRLARDAGCKDRAKSGTHEEQE